MKEPKDIDLELSAEECGHLIMGMNATIMNHEQIYPQIGGIDEDREQQIGEFKALRDKIKANLKEVGY